LRPSILPGQSLDASLHPHERAHIAPQVALPGQPCLIAGEHVAVEHVVGRTVEGFLRVLPCAARACAETHCRKAGVLPVPLLLQLWVGQPLQGIEHIVVDTELVGRQPGLHRPQLSRALTDEVLPRPGERGSLRQFASHRVTGAIDRPPSVAGVDCSPVDSSLILLLRPQSVGAVHVIGALDVGPRLLRSSLVAGRQFALRLICRLACCLLLLVGGFYVAPNIGQYINQAAQKVLGARDLANVEAEQEALNKEQLRRYDDISKQLATPGTKTVLKRTLRQGEGPLLEPNIDTTEQQVPLDYSNPDDLAADNARRMGLAMQMSKLQLPQAQKVAQDYLAKGTTFPDTLAQLQLRQIEAGQQNAARLAEQARIEREREEGRNQRAADAAALRMTLKSMGGHGGGPRDRFSVQMGPDNQMYRVNLETGVATPITIGGAAPTEGAPGGTPGEGLVRPGQDKPLTEAQGKAVMYGTRAAQGHNILDKVGSSYNPAVVSAMHYTGNTPLIGSAVNASATPADQQVAQAQRNFLSAILRQESGAAISEGEWRYAREQYFPQPGDKPPVIAQKKANRELAIKGFGTIAGPKGGKAVEAEAANKSNLTTDEQAELERLRKKFGK